MNKEYTAIIKQEGDWWIGWIEEIPGVNYQEKTRDELMTSLKLTLKEALEFNRITEKDRIRSFSFRHNLSSVGQRQLSLLF